MNVISENADVAAFHAQTVEQMKSKNQVTTHRIL
jgi:hypothetical protein